MSLLNKSLIIECVNFDAYIEDITYIRNKIFVEELKISKKLEWDALDETAYHYIVKSEVNNIIAYARLLPSGKLGRVAVLKPWRFQGIGSVLVSVICEKASKLDINTIHLSSQVSAINFYLQLGFKIAGDSFVEAGIEHRSMHKTLK